MRKITMLLGAFIVGCFSTLAQLSAEIEKDTIQNLDEVIVTATKTKKQLSSSSVPVTVISKKELLQTNSSKLNEIIGEFVGLNIVNDHGAGIQIQGMSSDYALILIDGQQIIGRTAGTFDLSRINVNDIEKIEVVKGPSSSLYGSEALAGVVNIITRKGKETRGSLRAKVGTNTTYDVSGEVNLNQDKFNWNVFVNRYQTDGYKLIPNSVNPTVNAFGNNTFNSKINYDFSEKTNLEIFGRYFVENQKFDFENSGSVMVSNESKERDYSSKIHLNHQFSNNLNSVLKAYYTKYKTDVEQTLLVNGNDFYNSFYNETLLNTELQTDYKINKHILTIGFGLNRETVFTSRISDENTFAANNPFAYGQFQYNPSKKLNFTLGARVDNHQNYNTQVNPKFSLFYKATDDLSFNASVGRGFKRPAFRQFYLNFTNQSVGYSVFGSTFVKDAIDQLLSSNEIALENGQPILFPLYHTIVENSGKLNPETSTGINIGLKYNPVQSLFIDANIFRNDLRDLIDAAPVALKANGSFAYSYRNFSKIFTQGVEVNFKYYIGNEIKLMAGYQYLDAKDKEILNRIDEEGIYATGSNGAYRLSKNQYGGLFNRSKHTANIKAYFNDIYKGFSGNLRVLFRGRYGLFDLNNNQILDADNEYAEASTLVNTNISKNFLRDSLNLQIGVDNVFDYTYTKYDDNGKIQYLNSSLPGRLLYTTITYKF